MTHWESGPSLWTYLTLCFCRNLWSADKSAVTQPFCRPASEPAGHQVSRDTHHILLWGHGGQDGSEQAFIAPKLQVRLIFLRVLSLTLLRLRFINTLELELLSYTYSIHLNWRAGLFWGLKSCSVIASIKKDLISCWFIAWSGCASCSIRATRLSPPCFITSDPIC